MSVPVKSGSFRRGGFILGPCASSPVFGNGAIDAPRRLGVAAVDKYESIDLAFLVDVLGVGDAVLEARWLAAVGSGVAALDAAHNNQRAHGPVENAAEYVLVHVIVVAGDSSTRSVA